MTQVCLQVPSPRVDLREDCRPCQLLRQHFQCGQWVGIRYDNIIQGCQVNTVKKFIVWLSHQHQIWYSWRRVDFLYEVKFHYPLKLCSHLATKLQVVVDVGIASQESLTSWSLACVNSHRCSRTPWVAPDTTDVMCSTAEMVAPAGLIILKHNVLNKSMPLTNLVTADIRPGFLSKCPECTLNPSIPGLAHWGAVFRSAYFSPSGKSQTIK